MSTETTVAPSQSTWADPNDLRTSFTLAMSSMYKSEVPLYGDLVRIVSHIATSNQTFSHCDMETMALDPRRQLILSVTEQFDLVPRVSYVPSNVFLL
jgi:hypothetical protein